MSKLFSETSSQRWVRLPSAYLLRLKEGIFFNDTATTEIYTLSLHDALPICRLADGDHPSIDPRLDAMSRDLLTVITPFWLLWW